MHVDHRVRFAAIVAAVAVNLASCDSSEGLPLLTDAHQIVTAAATSTTALSSVHVQVDLSGQSADDPGGQERVRILIETDIDVQRRNVAGRSQITIGDRPGAVAETSEFVLLDGNAFWRESTAPRWFVNDNVGNGDHLPSNAAYLDLIELAVANGSADLELADAVPCGASNCYHVTASLDQEAAWPLIVGPLVGDSVEAGLAPPPGRATSPAALDVFVDQQTRLLAGLSGTFSVDSTSVGFTMTFSNHDLPIRIAPPPPQLVEDPNDGGFRPVPTPAPQPLESPVP